MAKQTQAACDNIVHNYLAAEGWLPPGTTDDSWQEVRIGDLQLDDPPLPSSPHLQKQRVARDLQQIFFWLQAKLTSPLAQLKKPDLTLRQFCDWCFANHS